MTLTEPAPTDTSTTPAWSGVNHLALITPDMDATVRFYHGVLGARLVATVGTPDFRHYFFEFGPKSTVAFFEYKGLEVNAFAIGAGTPDPRKAQFDCEVTDIVDHGSIHSVCFSDPHGIALEASWWVKDVTAADADYDDPDVFGDPHPVPAVAELRATGRLTPGAGTRLS